MYLAQGWLNHFFGSKGTNELTLENFTKFLRQLNQDVLKMEYDLYDKQSLGYLSQRYFFWVSSIVSLLGVLSDSIAHLCITEILVFC